MIGLTVIQSDSGRQVAFFASFSDYLWSANHYFSAFRPAKGFTMKIFAVALFVGLVAVASANQECYKAANNFCDANNKRFSQECKYFAVLEVTQIV